MWNRTRNGDFEVSDLIFGAFFFVPDCHWWTSATKIRGGWVVLRFTEDCITLPVWLVYAIIDIPKTGGRTLLMKKDKENPVSSASYVTAHWEYTQLRLFKSLFVFSYFLSSSVSVRVCRYLCPPPPFLPTHLPPLPAYTHYLHLKRLASPFFLLYIFF